MKKLGLISVLLIAGFVACDKVKNPLGEAAENINCTVNSSCNVTAHIVKTNASTLKGRRVLVEDYTGHTCGNCPPAARKIEQLLSTYKDSMVVMAVHAGKSFAEPLAQDSCFEEFRNQAGETWDVFLEMSKKGNPKVAVNRAQDPYQASWNSLSGLIPTNLRKAQTVKLDIITTLDTVQMLLNVSVKTTFLTGFTDNIKLCVAMLEDSIIGPQKDYTPPSSAIVTPNFNDITINYEFMHVLRGSISCPWGDLLKKSPIAQNDTVTKKYTCYKVEPFRKIKKYYKNMKVVAFVYNDLNKEVLQAEELHIK